MLLQLTWSRSERKKEIGDILSIYLEMSGRHHLASPWHCHVLLASHKTRRISSGEGAEWSRRPQKQDGQRITGNRATNV
jgi:hypothetical protein